MNIHQLCSHLLPSDEVQHIRYFTAKVKPRPEDPRQAIRQQTYLRALQTLPSLDIHYGHFLTQTVRMRVASEKKAYVKVLKTEEKGSDVNLATYLLLDLFQQKCDTAIIISNDSDLAAPIQIGKEQFGARIGVLNPQRHGSNSKVLQPTFFKRIRENTLKKSQFPDQIKHGRSKIHKPSTW